MPIDIESAKQSIEEAKEKSGDRNFQQSVDAIINLREFDVKDQQNRISADVFLPNGMGREAKICIIGEGDLVLQAKEAGLKVLTKDDLESLSDDRKEVKKLADEYDSFVAQTNMMPQVGRSLGSVLGPRGKMPTPVAPNADLDDVVGRLSNTISIRTQRSQPIINSCIGTEEMSNEDLVQNLNAVVEAVERNLPRGHENVRSVKVKTTMGKPVEVAR